MNEENLRLQKELNENTKPTSNKPKPTPDSKKKMTSKAGSEDLPGSSTTLPPRGQKRGRELEIEKEEDFMKRHDVKISIPDNLKALLVDDWENVTKNQQLVPLPRDLNVSQLLQKYRDSVPKKREGSADADIFDEVIAGLKLYFDRSLGTILLYRFERQQYLEIRKEHPGKEPSEIYGAEHLLRLFGEFSSECKIMANFPLTRIFYITVSMPELLAHTNMDPQSISKLREHIESLICFLAKNPEQYISAHYESGSYQS